MKSTERDFAFPPYRICIRTTSNMVMVSFVFHEERRKHVGISLNEFSATWIESSVQVLSLCNPVTQPVT